MCATAWQCGQVTTRFFSWSWCRWLAESMYRDMAVRGGSCCCVCRVDPMLPQRAPECSSRDLHCITHGGASYVTAGRSPPKQGSAPPGGPPTITVPGGPHPARNDHG